MPPAARPSQHPADHVPSTWNPEYEKIIIEMLKSPLKVGQGAEIGRRTVKYLRPKDMCKWLWENYSFLESTFGKSRVLEMLQVNEPYKIIKKENTYPDGFDIDNLRPVDFVPICETLLRMRFLYRADRQDVQIAQKPESKNKEATEDDIEESKTEDKTDDEKNDKNITKDSRWPKRIVPYPVNSQEAYEFSLNSFYVMAYTNQKGDKWRYLMFVGIVAAVLMVVMFPAWPTPYRRLGAFVVVGLATSMVGISILRLVAFLLLWYAGFDFWILPNFYADDLPFLDCFRPLYYFKSRNDRKMMYVVRFVAFLMMVMMFFKLGETHSITDIGEFATVYYLELVDWGVDKIAGTSEEIVAANKNIFAINEDAFVDLDEDEIEDVRNFMKNTFKDKEEDDDVEEEEEETVVG